MESLEHKVKRLKSKKQTWQAVGEEIGISSALAWKVAHGKCDSAVARHYFNMPPAAVEVAPCVVCGGVHTLKTCNAKRKRNNVDRMAARLSPEDGERAREKLKAEGFKSITQFWEWYLADGQWLLD